MQAILMIADDPEKAGALEIKVLRVLTPAEMAAGVGQHETLASKYMLHLESILMEAVETVVGGATAYAAQKEGERSCLH